MPVLLLNLLLSFLLAGAPRSLAQPAAAPAVSTAAASAEKSESQKFADLARDYWDAQMRLSPLTATFVNYPGHNDKLDDISDEGRKAEVREMGEILKRLAGIDRAKLSESDRVSAGIMKLEIDRRLEAQKYKFYEWDVDHLDGPQSWIPSVIALAQPMRTPADAEALLARMKALPGFFKQQVDNLREGLKDRRIAARVPVEKAIAQLDDLIKTPPDQSPFAAAAKKLPVVVKARYLPQIVAAINEQVLPAYQSYRAFLKDEYLSKAREEKVGLSALPGGRDAYLFKIRCHTTLPKTPEELHKAGKEELESIRAEMSALERKMGRTEDLNAYLDAVRKDPANFFKTREEVLEAAKVIVASATAKLPEFFATLPKTALVVKAIEDYKEKNDVAARYYPPPDDLSRPGIYYINTYAPQTRPRFSMVSLAAHEGVPGHHLQIALALEQRDLPAFRRNADFTAYIEGWALYCERLAGEMGLYADDLSRLGMLSDQALRASRLVVDTGLHAMGWSRRRAIDYMKANTPMSEAEITAEVDRYLVWPGQALAYKVGQREITALRKEAQDALGPRFDLKAFHDAVLKNGAVPLPILRETVEDYIKKQAAPASGPQRSRTP